MPILLRGAAFNPRGGILKAPFLQRVSDGVGAAIEAEGGADPRVRETAIVFRSGHEVDQGLDLLGRERGRAAGMLARRFGVGARVLHGAVREAVLGRDGLIGPADVAEGADAEPFVACQARSLFGY